MKVRIVVISILSLLLCASTAFSRDVKKNFSIRDAMEKPVVQDVLNNGVALYWGDQPHPAVVREYGTFKSNKRTNGFRKKHDDACARALASALVALQDRADREGGNGVINIKSYIKNRENSSSTEYSCLVGGMMVNVVLKGTVVQLAR
ncbi:phosphoribosylglycinamide formyltransferase [Desulfomarina profundi]|uniref:Phosphoribosylglycinamide formyltransferase n=1 Tax=Desulfomarina profundi TaxID=2772557 RepID=A0A8D5FMB1_9BACT|nr:hypothetical protein [Desulfomarina profundi]BCL61673.1 phosphoribosylglycinamide formyltransferase [Desulfomarina profundi]